MGDYILAHLFPIGLQDFLVALARVKRKALSGLCVLMVVESCDDASVGDHHGHFHLYMEDLAALVVLKPL